MKFRISNLRFPALALSNASAQVASHASTYRNADHTMAMAVPKATGKPVARVNGAVLTDKDLVREEYLIFPYARQHDGKIPRRWPPGSARARWR